MPSAGFVIGGTVRCEGSTQLFSSGPPPLAPVDWLGSGLARLSQATIAFTRGSHWPMYDTPAAPYECPAMPSREGFNSFQNGLYGASRPAFASVGAAYQYSCSSACTEPLVITMPGRLAGPALVAHTCPDSVAPLRAVNSTGCTMP